jgi:acyl carrier protein
VEETNVESSTQARIDEVVDVLVTVLGIEDRRDSIDASTGLLGELPELDSLAVVELAVSLEERFGIVIDDDEFTGDVFDTVGSLAAFIDAKTSDD